eukprot:351515-Chlamydomonas_euryale.AAC.3
MSADVGESQWFAWLWLRGMLGRICVAVAQRNAWQRRLGGCCSVRHSAASACRVLGWLAAIIDCFAGQE